MSSNRANSPDKYIGITKNFQDRALTKGEKLMLLNVYGVLRKEVRLSVDTAATKAAELCGVSSSALFSAKTEVDNGQITLPNISLGESHPHEKNNVIASKNDAEHRPSDLSAYHIVKAKIFELLRESGTTTMASVIEAFRNDPLLPDLEDTAIRWIVQILNLTSHLVPASEESQQCNKDTSIQEAQPPEDTSDTSAIVSSAGSNVDITSIHRANSVADRNMEVNNDCCIVYDCRSGGHAQDMKPPTISDGVLHATIIVSNATLLPETILPDATEQNRTNTTDQLQLKVEDSVVVKREVSNEWTDQTPPNLDGIFPDKPTLSELEDSSIESGDTNNCNILLRAVSSRPNHSNSNTFFPIVRNSSILGEAKTIDPISDQIFQNASELSVGAADNPVGGVNLNTYAFPVANQQPAYRYLTGMNNHPQTFSDILVNGLNETRDSDHFSFVTNMDSPRSLYYINNVPADDSSNSAGIFVDSLPEFTNDNGVNSFTLHASPPLPLPPPPEVFVSSDQLQVFTLASHPDGSVSSCDKTHKSNDLISPWGFCQPQNKIVKKHQSDKTYYSCNLCLKRFNRQGPLCKHLSYAHRPIGGAIAGTGFFKCKYCFKGFSKFQLKNFIQHSMYMHTMKSLKCDFCHLAFATAQKLIHHVSTLHVNSFLEQQGCLLV